MEDLKEAAIQELTNALCSDREVEAYKNLTPLEQGFLAQPLEDLEYTLNLLYQSVGTDSAKRFALCWIAFGNVYMQKIEEVENASRTK